MSAPDATTGPIDELRVRTSDGMELHADAVGAPDAPPVVLIHGGGQTRHSWGGTADALAVNV